MPPAFAMATQRSSGGGREGARGAGGVRTLAGDVADAHGGVEERLDGLVRGAEEGEEEREGLEERGHGDVREREVRERLEEVGTHLRVGGGLEHGDEALRRALRRERIAQRLLLGCTSEEGGAGARQVAVGGREGRIDLGMGVSERRRGHARRAGSEQSQLSVASAYHGDDRVGRRNERGAGLL